MAINPCRPHGRHAFLPIAVASLLVASEDTEAFHVTAPARIDDRQAPLHSKFSSRDLERLWWDLAAEPFTARQAMNKLFTSPEQSLTLLRERLMPAIAVDRDKLRKLAAQLASKNAAVRERAAAKLVHYGELAGPALRETLDKQRPLETNLGAETVLEIICEQPRPAAVQRVLRAIEVLERLGTTPAREVLGKLAVGAPGHAITCEAEAALMRLRQR